MCEYNLKLNYNVIKRSIRIFYSFVFIISVGQREIVKSRSKNEALFGVGSNHVFPDHENDGTNTSS